MKNFIQYFGGRDSVPTRNWGHGAAGTNDLSEDSRSTGSTIKIKANHNCDSAYHDEKYISPGKALDECFYQVWSQSDERFVRKCAEPALEIRDKERGTASIDSSPPEQNGRHFPDDIFKCIFMNEKFRILIRISPKFVHKRPINNIPAMVQIMVWRRSGKAWLQWRKSNLSESWLRSLQSVTDKLTDKQAIQWFTVYGWKKSETKGEVLQCFYKTQRITNICNVYFPTLHQELT